MKKSELRKMIRELIESEVITLPKPKTKPGIQTPERKHNPLRPPKEAPSTKPKTIYEKDPIRDKITQRFLKLKNE